MIRYYYDADTGEITRKSSGTIHFVETDPYIETEQDVDITQYVISNETLMWSQTTKATNPRQT